MTEMITLGTINIKGPPYSPHDLKAYVVQKKDRNFIQGVTWQATANFLGVAALSTAAATLYGLGQIITQTALSALKNESEPSDPSFLENYGLNNAPGVCFLVTLTTVANALFFKGVSMCYEKAHYHLGPEYEVVIPSTFRPSHPILGEPEIDAFYQQTPRQTPRARS